MSLNQSISDLDQLIDPELLEQLTTSSAIQSLSSTPTPIPIPGDRRTRKRPRKAWVWNHMPDDSDTIYHDTQGRVQWRCRYCPVAYLETGGTTAIQNHLVNKHEKREHSSQGKKAVQVQASIAATFARANEINHARRRLTTTTINPV